jgi:hypothetical protein
MVTKINRQHSQAAAPAPSARVAASERMSKVDTAWLRMDSPCNLMMIMGVWIIQPGVGYSETCQRVEERMLKYPRFAQRVQQDSTGASWIYDDDFKISRHVLRETLGPLAKTQPQQALQERLGELALQPLDSRYPLWDFRLVEDYMGGSALLVRIHHCIADGLALISVIQTLVDGGTDPPSANPNRAIRPVGMPPKSGCHIP